MTFNNVIKGYIYVIEDDDELVHISSMFKKTHTFNMLVGSFVGRSWSSTDT